MFKFSGNILLGALLIFQINVFAQTAYLDSRGGFTDLSVNAGSYSLSVVSGPWNAWNGNTGIDPFTGHLRGWLTSYSGLTSGGVSFGTSSVPYQTMGAAMAAPPTQILNFNKPESIRLFISDPIPSDNIGVLGLSVKKIPDNPFENSTKERLAKGFAALQAFMDPGLIADIVSNYVRTSDIAAFINELGTHITPTLTSTLTRIGGVIQNLGIGLLDADVANGVDQIHRSLTDPNPEVRGLTNAQERRALTEVFAEMDKDFPQIKPKSTADGLNKFDVEVEGGRIHVFDPKISSAFIYKVGNNDPNFQSAVLPFIGNFQDSFKVDLWNGSDWNFFGESTPLRELIFPEGVREFRISGINSQELDPNTEWFAGVSFSENGRFTGSIMADGSSTNVAEPTTLNLLLIGIALFFMRNASVYFVRK